MKTRNFLPLAATLSAAATTHVQAHEGHGVAGASHWHATDAWGFLALVAVALAVWYFTRGD